MVMSSIGKILIPFEYCDAREWNSLLFPTSTQRAHTARPLAAHSAESWDMQAIARHLFNQTNVKTRYSEFLPPLALPRQGIPARLSVRQKTLEHRRM